MIALKVMKARGLVLRALPSRAIHTPSQSSEPFLKVNEMFYSIQGEGQSQGKPSVFLRLATCNLTCSWCDTKYTWLYNQPTMMKFMNKIPPQEKDQVLASKDVKIYNIKEEAKKMYLPEVLQKIQSYSPAKNVVITGGEPLLQSDVISLMIQELHKQGISVEIETNGTLTPGDLPQTVQFNVSPKLSNSHNSKNERFIPSVLSAFLRYPRAYFKFVVGKEDNWEEVKEIINEVGIPRERVYLMPECRSREEMASKALWVVDLCLREGVNFSNRLHVQLWDSKRGV